MTQAFDPGTMEWSADSDPRELFPPLNLETGFEVDPFSQPMIAETGSLPEPGFMAVSGLAGGTPFGQDQGLLPHPSEGEDPLQPLRIDEPAEPVFLPADASDADMTIEPESTAEQPRRTLRAPRNRQAPARFRTVGDTSAPPVVPTDMSAGRGKRKRSATQSGDTDERARSTGSRPAKAKGPKAKKPKLSPKERQSKADREAAGTITGATTTIALATGIISWLRTATETEAVNFTVAVIGSKIYLTKVNGVTSGHVTIKLLQQRLLSWPITVACELILCKKFTSDSSAHAEMGILAAVGLNNIGSIQYLECTCTSCAYCALTLQLYGVPNSSPHDRPAKTQQGWRHPFWRLSFGTQVSDERAQIALLRDWFMRRDAYDKGSPLPDEWGRRGENASPLKHGQVEAWLTLPVRSAADIGGSSAESGDGRPADDAGGKMETS